MTFDFRVLALESASWGSVAMIWWSPCRLRSVACGKGLQFSTIQGAGSHNENKPSKLSMKEIPSCKELDMEPLPGYPTVLLWVFIPNTCRTVRLYVSSFRQTLGDNRRDNPAKLYLRSRITSPTLYVGFHCGSPTSQRITVDLTAEIFGN